MTYQDDVERFNPIKILTDPPDLKSLESDENTSKEDLLEENFIRVKIFTI